MRIAPAVIHDYKRNGTASLFAALNTLDGKVISLCHEWHRHQEWIKFLRLVDDATPSHKQLHLVADYYATHKHPKVQRWLTRHPRFHVHFHADRSLLAEHGRTLLSRPHPSGPPQPKTFWKK